MLAAISNYQNTLHSVVPYLFLLGVFGTFVTVNGGVVLGMSHSLLKYYAAYFVKGIKRTM